MSLVFDTSVLIDSPPAQEYVSSVQEICIDPRLLSVVVADSATVCSPWTR
jgi:hypothetical protein